MQAAFMKGSHLLLCRCIPFSTSSEASSPEQASSVTLSRLMLPKPRGSSLMRWDINSWLFQTPGYSPSSVHSGKSCTSDEELQPVASGCLKHICIYPGTSLRKGKDRKA